MKRGAGCALAFMLSVAVASAEPNPVDCGSHHPWILLSVPEAFRDQVVTQLRAGLAGRAIDVCISRSPHAPEPLAEVVLTRRQQSQVTITVEAVDAVTDKRVSRDLDLGGLPPDTWALALAVAADEIIRASWAELALKRRRPASRPVPSSVREVVADSLGPAPRQPGRWLLGAAGVAEAYPAGDQTQLGVDLRLVAKLLDPVSLGVVAGLRSALPASSDRGSVHASVLVMGVGARVQLTPLGASVGADVFARGELWRVDYRATPAAGARGTSGAASAVLAKAGVGGFWAPDPVFRVFAEAALAVPVRQAAAVDAGEPIMAVEGVGAALGVGVGAAL